MPKIIKFLALNARITAFPKIPEGAGTVITLGSPQIAGLVGALPLARYFESRFAVGDRTTAEFLQNRNNWEIANAIIDAGVEGTTSRELAEQLNINYKIVTEVTKRLVQKEWIRSEPPIRKLGRPPKEARRRDFRKPRLVHVWNYLGVFEPQLDEKFEDYCMQMFDTHADQFGQFVNAFDQIVAEMKQSGNKFYPKETIHEHCSWSHEGYEFIRALLQAFTVWLESHAQFQNVLKKYEIATHAAFEE
jgi:Mn-dependent DtxR family transcriptional regulator